MEQIISQITEYFKKNLDISLSINTWKDFGNLPLYLRERYEIYTVEILGLPCLLICDIGDNEQAPGIIKTHLEKIRDKCAGQEMVYCRDQVTSYNRKRLIEQKVPFIIPGNQMYLPMLAVDFHEHFRKITKPSLLFSPLSQLILLHVFKTPKNESVSAVTLARIYGYSKVSIFRSFDEIENTGIAKTLSVGRERRMILDTGGKFLWEKIRLMLRSPIHKRIYIKKSEKIKNWPLAGESALAQYSLLSSPSHNVYAVSKTTWNEYSALNKPEIVPHLENDCVEIEVWKYDPKEFALHGIVDRLSLFLSLQEIQNERVEMALGEMMEGMQW